jgi:putative membrane protein
VPAIADISPRGLADTTQWGVDPWSLAPLALTLVFYVVGLILLWRKAGTGRGIRLRHVAAFGGGWLILALALESPLHFWGERLFSAHMIEHEIVMVIAAPLLVISRPLIPFLWALPIPWRRCLGGTRGLRGFRPAWDGITRPLTAWIVHTTVLWVWHVPAVFRAALASLACPGRISRGACLRGNPCRPAFVLSRRGIALLGVAVVPS